MRIRIQPKRRWVKILEATLAKWEMMSDVNAEIKVKIGTQRKDETGQRGSGEHSGDPTAKDKTLKEWEGDG